MDTQQANKMLCFCQQNVHQIISSERKEKCCFEKENFFFFQSNIFFRRRNKEFRCDTTKQSFICYLFFFLRYIFHGYFKASSVRISVSVLQIPAANTKKKNPSIFHGLLHTICIFIHRTMNKKNILVKKKTADNERYMQC